MAHCSILSDNTDIMLAYCSFAVTVYDTILCSLVFKS